MAFRKLKKRPKQKMPAERVFSKTLKPGKHLFDKTELFRIPSVEEVFFYEERKISGTCKMDAQEAGDFDHWNGRKAVYEWYCK